MLEAIVDFLNLNLQLLNYFEKRHCLSTLVKTDKGMVYPAEYVSKGNYNAIDFDAFDGVSYIRLTNDISFDRIDNKYTPSPRINITFPLRVVFSVGKDKLSVDDAYSFDRVRASIAKQLESDPLDLTTQLKADNVVITTGDYIEDAKTLWDEETAETGQYQPKYEVVFGALEVTVTVTIKKECIPAECDNFESDILRTFDFCKPAIQQRLTEAQQTCLSDWLCTPTPCDDATVTLNGVTMTTIPAGDTENILVLQSNDMTQVGSKQGTHWRIDDSAISINGSLVANVKAEDPLDIDVTQDGSPVGSWNGSAWIIPSCPSSSSLSVAVSNATPDYNGTVTITATPSGISPTSYTFLIACQNDGDAYVTQASNVLVWTVNRVGAIKVSVTATDGVETVGATADLTVTDPLNYAAKLVDYDMRNNITLVGGLVDIVGDSSGNGHDVTAISSVNRAFYDAYSKRYDTGASVRNLRNTASNPLSGVADFTMLIKFQKQGADSDNQRVITFGTNGNGFAVAPYNAVGGTIIIGTNNFTQYQAATVDVVGGEPFAIVKNGANPYDVYADGVITSVVSSIGTTPATIPTGNGIYLGTQNGTFPLIGSIQRIVVFDSVLTATQVAAVNERIKVLHP